MKLPLLRILCLLLSFALFEVSICMPFIIQNGFGPDERFMRLVFYSSPFVALSQITLLAMWGGLGAFATHRRIFYAASCCIACSLIPVAVGQSTNPQEKELVGYFAIVISTVFAFCLLFFFIFGHLFRRKLVVLDGAGVASFGTKSQFSLRFLAVVTLTVAFFCMEANAFLPKVVGRLLPATLIVLIIGLIVGIIFFAQGIAFTWILLRPKPMTPWTFIWLAITAAVILSLYFAIWLVSVWGNSAAWDFRSFLPLLASGVVWLSCSMASLCIMRYLDFRLVRIDQLNEVVKNPLARPTAIAEWPID